MSLRALAFEQGLFFRYYAKLHMMQIAKVYNRQS